MEEIQNESAQTTETEAVAEEVGASEIADTGNDVEFTDQSGEESTREDSVETKTVEKTHKTNADYARERRKAEHEAALKKARYDAIIETLNGENPFTHEKMEDEADVQEYLTMKEIEKKGLDPIADYSKHLKAKAKEQEKATREKNTQEEWVQKDREEFASKHPDVSLSDLVKDEMFRTFALGKVGTMSMDKIYTDYQSFISKSEERAKDKAAQLLANSAATPGKLTDQSPTPPKRVEDMSKAEFNQMVDKVKRGEIKQLK